MKSFDTRLEEFVLNKLSEEKENITKSGIGTLFDVGETSELLVGLTIPILLDLMKNEGQAQLERLNTTEPFNPNNETVQESIRRRFVLLESYVSTTLQLLNNSLGEGVAEGKVLQSLHDVLVTYSL